MLYLLSLPLSRTEIVFQWGGGGSLSVGIISGRNTVLSLSIFSRNLAGNMYASYSKGDVKERVAFKLSFLFYKLSFGLNKFFSSDARNFEAIIHGVCFLSLLCSNWLDQEIFSTNVLWHLLCQHVTWRMVKAGCIFSPCS